MPIYNEELLLSHPKYLHGNLQIIACAGSGKTELVAERIAFQIREKITRPEEIVAFTFTVKAAEELKFRVRMKIKELIGHQPDIGDMFIGTIHAFAFSLLKEVEPAYMGFDMMDGNGRLAFLSSIRYLINADTLVEELDGNFDKPYGAKKKDWVYNAFIKDLDKIVDEGWDLERISDSEAFITSFRQYQALLEERRFLDFSIVQRKTVELLKTNDKLRGRVRKQFKFFTVDEYQDVNPIQEELIALISGRQNVCVVGDDDQSIYRWRGADLNNILTFQERYTDVAVLKLEMNRRSHDKIVLSAKTFIEQNGSRLEKSITDKGIKSEAGDLYKISFLHQEEELEWIVGKIKHLVGTGYEDQGEVRRLMYSDIALLFRSAKNESGAYLEAFEEAGIPYLCSGIGGLFEDPLILGIMDVFNFIAQVDLYQEVIYDDHYLTTVYSKLVRVFKTIPAIAFIDGIKKMSEEIEAEASISIQKIFYQILALLKLNDPMHHEKEDDVFLYNLGQFSQAITDYEQTREVMNFEHLKDFIWYIRLHAEKNYDLGRGVSDAVMVDAVQIMTMHGTKGLGFPVVFLPNNRGKKTMKKKKDSPSWIKKGLVDLSRYENTVEDERRVSYVAMTRAKKYLFVTNNQIKIDGKQKWKASNFFKELKDDYFITQPIDDPSIREQCDVVRYHVEQKFPTSYSKLSYYLKCGYDYKMRFVYGFNPGLVEAMGFGSQVHNIINLLHNEYEQVGVLPGAESLEDLLDEHFYMRYAPPLVENELKVAAYKSLLNYIKIWAEDFALSIRTERPFELEFNQAIIAGAIDMLRRSDPTHPTLEVIDFKTGKPNGDLMEKYILQVRLYTIAAKEALGLDIKDAKIHFLDTSTNERLGIPITAADIEVTKQSLARAIAGIGGMDFGRTARDGGVCAGCDWFGICVGV